MKFMKLSLIFIFLVILVLKNNVLVSQDLDPEEFLDRLDRVERNISDLQKGIIDNIDKNLTSGYISRNESRLDKLETENQKNFGVLEELDNKLSEIQKKIDLINTDISIRLGDIEKSIEQINLIDVKKVIGIDTPDQDNQTFEIINDLDSGDEQNKVKSNQMQKSLEGIDPKVKYENAIKLLWSNKLDEALEELLILKEIKPEDLMPNIQYWLGEVFYAKKDFNQAAIEFGEGLKNYPESIKGPDNMLKLGLSFSNLSKINEACNVLIELELKYPDASKDVLQRSIKERKKMECPQE
jgi:TolA-binding protein